MDNKSVWKFAIPLMTLLLAACGGGGGGGTTTGILPAVPTALNATPTSSGSVSLSWQDNATSEEGYVVERSEVSATSGFAPVMTLGVDATSCDDIGLSPSTQYFYRVAATAAAGNSDYSNVADAITDAAPVSAPTAPTSLTATAASTTSINLFWNDTSNNESWFSISQATNVGGPFAEVATAAANAQSVTVSGLSAATTYYFKVAAVNAAGVSADSNVANATTSSLATTVPTAPTGLSVGGATSASLTLNWTDNSTDETGFKVYRATSQFGTYTLVTTVAANTTSYTNSGLSVSATYWYKVRASNSAGDSADSNAASGTTLAPATTIPTAPSGLTVGSATSSSLTLSWTDNSTNESGFKVYRAATQFGTYTLVTTLAANATYYTNTGLAASTAYWYKVRAYNSAGDSADSNAASGTTLAPPVTIPTAPSGLTVGSATGSSLTLSWSDNSSNESGFKVFRSATQFGTYLQVAAVGANVVSYTNTGLSASTTYWYKVLAYNSAGNSAYSNSASGTTLVNVQTVTLSPSFDNLLMTSNSNTAVNTTVYQSSELAVGCNWDYSTVTYLQYYICGQGLVQFDLAPYAGKTIDSATLNLTTNYIGVGYFPRQWYLRQLLSAWVPASVTYSNFNPYSYWTDTAILQNAPNYAGQLYALDVTAIVQSWVNGTRANYGWILDSADYTFPYAVSLDAFSFYSKEFGASFGPQLVVTYH